MRKLTKKISMLMVLAMLVGLFSGVVSASAASKWSFKSNDLDVAVGATVNLDQNQYENFDLYKSGAIADEATYTITWESSDEKVVFVNAKTGQLRAKKDAADGAEAVITANIVNNKSKAGHKVSFTVVVGEVKAPVYTVECDAISVEVGAEVKFAPVVKDEAGEVVKFATHKSYNGYFLDGKAITNPWTPEEAGEYTVTVAQFAAKTDVADLAKAVRKIDVTVTVAYNGIVSAKQTTFNTVALTCGTAEVAAAVEKNVADLKVAYVLGDNNIAAFVKSATVDKKDATVVNVELLNSLIKDTTYNFTFGEDTVSVVGADLNQYHSIAVNTPSVPKGEAAQIEILFYNKDGVVVDKKKDGFTIKADLNNDFAIVGGDKLYFYNAGKSATVTVTYYMGFDNQGNKIDDLTTTATITSFDKAAKTSSTINSWTINNGTNYGEGNFKLAITDISKELGFKYTVYDVYNQGKELTNKDLIPTELSFNRFAFTSTNDKVIMVKSDGTVYPLGAGTAQVIVETVDKNDPNKKIAIGVCTFTVEANRKLTTLNPTANKISMSDADVDSIRIKPDAKDQLGDAIEPSYFIKLANNIGDGVEIYVVQGKDDRTAAESDDIKLVYNPDIDGSAVSITGKDNGTPFFDVYAKGGVSWVKNAQISITALQGQPYSKLTRFVTVQVKEEGEAVYYGLDALTESFDMNILARPSWASDDWYYKTDIKLCGYDSSNNLVSRPELGLGAASAKNNGDFYYEVTKGTENVNALIANDAFKVISTSGASQLVKINKGTGVYTVTVYQKQAEAPRFITAKNIVVTDTSSAITVDQVANKITSAQVTSGGATVVKVLNDSLKLKRDGKDANNATIVAAKYTVVDSKLYLTSVTVREGFDGFGWYEVVKDSGEYAQKKLDVEVNVGAVFEIN